MWLALIECGPSPSALHTYRDAVKSCHPVDLTFHEPVSREIRDVLAGASLRTAEGARRCPGLSFVPPSRTITSAICIEER